MEKACSPSYENIFTAFLQLFVSFRIKIFLHSYFTSYDVLGLLCLCCFMTLDLLLFESEFNFATSSWTAGAELGSGLRIFLEAEIYKLDCSVCIKSELFTADPLRRRKT